jgi:hypothetical protein
LGVVLASGACITAFLRLTVFGSETLSPLVTLGGCVASSAKSEETFADFVHACVECALIVGVANGVGISAILLSLRLRRGTFSPIGALLIFYAKGSKRESTIT